MKKILIINENSDDLWIVPNALRDAGYNVLDTEVPDQIEVVLMRFKPDLLITDMAMSMTKGLDIITKAIEFLPDIPVIAISEIDFYDYKYFQKANFQGANAIWFRSDAPTSLVETVREYLG